MSTTELDTPCLLLDLDKLDANIGRMAQRVAAAGIALRPHAKTHKLVPVARRQLSAGAVGLTVAKLGEAELLVRNDIRDVLIAYPLWGAGKWKRLCRLAEACDVRVGADSFEVFEGISTAAHARGITIPVRIEVDTGFGRCGVQGPGEALALAQRISKLHGVELVGVMSFAGQTYGAGPDRIEKVAVAEVARLIETAVTLRAGGFEVPEISAGGTPSAIRAESLVAGADQHPAITEIRPGTYVFSDRDQAAMGWGTPDDCALTALATVVSRPTPTRAVIDAGTKTLSSDRAANVDGLGEVRGHPTWRIASLSEEHGVLEVPDGEAPLGTQLQIVPNHACGMLNMHDWVAACRDGQVMEWWPVEGRGLIR